MNNFKLLRNLKAYIIFGRSDHKIKVANKSYDKFTIYVCT